MSLYYSKTAAGFYDSAIHAKAQIPADAVEISAAKHRELLAAQAQGKMISADGNGWPMAIDRPAPTPAQLAELNRTAITREIQRIESGQARAVREVALGVAGASERLRAIDDRIALLRADLAALATA